MAPKKSTLPAPLTFDLPSDLFAKIEICRKRLGLASASEVVRTAIERFDFAGCTPARTEHRQISVRLDGEQRAALRRHARNKDASIGELLRLAIDALHAHGPRPGRRRTASRRRR